ncbi:MAG TPA: sigma 54-interacting transcriptional regulator, partial [Candidatus Eisenbacteria bacterium]|nr:sigma 54-interacting transcriptional regulator [Candidatus Eisenbacteria bacterium]
MSEQPKDLFEKIRWLLLVRVTILSFFLGAAALFNFFRADGDPRLVYALLVPLIASYIISFGSFIVLPRLGNPRAFAYFQLDIDVILITGIIWITGGAESPLSFLYNLAVMNGAILLFYRGAFWTAGFSSLCYVTLLVWAQYQDNGATAFSWTVLMPMLMNVGSFFAIAGLGAFLAGKLSKAEKLLQAKQSDYQQLEALKEALLNGVGSGIAITDARGRINYYNAQAQNLTTLQEQFVRGKKLVEIFPGLTYGFDGLPEGRRIVAEEIRFSTSQGQQKHLRLTVAPLSNAAEELIGYVSIFEDITKQKEFEEKIRLEEELRKAREISFASGSVSTDDAEFRFEGVMGRSGGIEKIHQLIRKVAGSSTNVLICGESGTGKELVARAIHFNGPRRDQPFVAVNCGAIPVELIESELFGHSKGAFTGADRERAGLWEEADGGTIFLDEITETNPL